MPQDWAQAIGALKARRRILVLGATDVGKTTFIRMLTSARRKLAVIDLDPGQKMIGPPGTIGFGSIDALERFIFIGSTSASSLSAIWRGAEALASTQKHFVVNTAGFIRGIGARLQAGTIAAVKPDVIVLIGEADGLDPVLAAHEGIPLLRLRSSPNARRKSAGERRQLRQAAFEAALHQAEPVELLEPQFAPSSPRPFESTARPVCGIGGGGGDAAYGLLLSTEPVKLLARPPIAQAAAIRLGKMWAEPAEGGWRLLDRLTPSWTE
jgi:polynucleotide 5'-hydroxyl-kinase GRC3/NOL9